MRETLLASLIERTPRFWKKGRKMNTAFKVPITAAIAVQNIMDPVPNMVWVDTIL